MLLKMTHFRKAMATDPNIDHVWYLYKRLRTSPRAQRYLTLDTYRTLLLRLWNMAARRQWRFSPELAALRHAVPFPTPMPKIRLVTRQRIRDVALDMMRPPATMINTRSDGTSEALANPSKPSTVTRPSTIAATGFLERDWLVDLLIHVGFPSDALTLVQWLAEHDTTPRTDTLIRLFRAFQRHTDGLQMARTLWSGLPSTSEPAQDPRFHRAYIAALVHGQELAEAWQQIEVLQNLTQSPETPLVQHYIKYQARHGNADDASLAVRNYAAGLVASPTTQWTSTLAADLLNRLHSVPGRPPPAIATQNLATAEAAYAAYRTQTQLPHASVLTALLRTYLHYGHPTKATALHPLIQRTHRKPTLHLALALMEAYASLSDHQAVYVLYRDLLRDPHVVMTPFVTERLIRCFQASGNADMILHLVHYLSNREQLVVQTVDQALRASLAMNNSPLLTLVRWRLEVDYLSWTAETFRLVLLHFLESGNRRAADRIWTEWRTAVEIKPAPPPLDTLVDQCQMARAARHPRRQYLFT
ncbi:hypothetical protein IWQ60_011856 [Tieghemiomyces parasiticus]|uniref:Uncharacterized protein n=1 Tax=Tieghemiomyces parasiticus TaxID=78921 RepID=A0A9W7ZM31_9FUNG|nr:hypothetical protein IWQ60_011856 [Tieghemiomyces parasiticus]